MSLIAELKRRNVFRVGVAYVIGAWVIAQAADLVLDNIEAPDWVMQAIMLVLAIGLPLALILAWAFELTPDGVKRDSAVETSPGITSGTGQKLNYFILGLVLLGVLLLIFDRFALAPRSVNVISTDVAVSGSRPAFAGAVLLPETASLASGVASLGFDSTLIALSPGGNWLVYVGRSETGSLLYRQQTDEFEAPEAIPGTDGAIHPFFSPDGETIGFLTNDRIKSVSLDGGDVQTIATTRSPIRGIWTEGDWLYVFDEQGSSIKRVHASGGRVEAVIEWSAVVFSDILPNRTSALASRNFQSMNGDHAALVLVDLETGNSKPLDIHGYDARWIPTGHLLFGRNGNVYVVRFDLQRGVIEGEPQPVLKGAAMDSLFHQMQISVSASGALAFVPGADRGIGRLVAVDRENVERALASAPQKYSVLDLSTDDRLLAVHMADVKDYVWVYDLERQEGRKVVGSSGYGFPKFSPDRSLAFIAVWAMDETSVMIGSTDGAAPRMVYEFSEPAGAISDWSPAGDMLAVSSWTRGGVGLLAVDGQDAIQWLTDRSGDWGAVFSPDGQWLAYSSDETGRYEIWVLSIANPGLRRQLSVNGGIEPVWCPCGKVFFRRGDQFWASTVSLDTELDIGPEALQFSVRDFLDTPGRSYDVSSDGQTLFTVRRAEPTIDGRLHIMSNWLKDLEHQVPVGER